MLLQLKEAESAQGAALDDAADLAGRLHEASDRAAELEVLLKDSKKRESDLAAALKVYSTNLAEHLRGCESDCQYINISGTQWDYI